MNTVLFKTIYPSAINRVLLIVRLYLGPMIFTHGYRKIFRGGKLAGTDGWFDSIGMKPGNLNALAAASTELRVGRCWCLDS
jgi:putative oxidoreductase